MKILFVCKYNRFRSKIAEVYFKKVNKNKNVKAESAGIFKGSYPLDSQQMKLSRKLGVDIRSKPRGISTDLLKKTDMIIIVSDNVPKNLFTFKKKYVQKVIIWNILDELDGNESNTIKIINSIKDKVDNLVKQLEDKK